MLSEVFQALFVTNNSTKRYSLITQLEILGIKLTIVTCLFKQSDIECFILSSICQKP